MIDSWDNWKVIKNSVHYVADEQPEIMAELIERHDSL
jgi:hypothetical protein